MKQKSRQRILEEYNGVCERHRGYLRSWSQGKEGETEDARVIRTLAAAIETYRIEREQLQAESTFALHGAMERVERVERRKVEAVECIAQSLDKMAGWSIFGEKDRLPDEGLDDLEAQKKLRPPKDGLGTPPTHGG